MAGLKCLACDGLGQISEGSDGGHGGAEIWRQCAVCLGKGWREAENPSASGAVELAKPAENVHQHALNLLSLILDAFPGHSVSYFRVGGETAVSLLTKEKGVVECSPRCEDVREAITALYEKLVENAWRDFHPPQRHLARLGVEMKITARSLHK